MSSSWTAHPLLASPRPACSVAVRHRPYRGHGRWTLTLGPRWVRAAAVAHGQQRSPTVTNGSDKPQVLAIQLTQQRSREQATQMSSRRSQTLA
jgi:hypothetical protein